MDQDQAEFTVEYQDMNGILYYEIVRAADIAGAKAFISGKYPEAFIRAVTLTEPAEFVETD
ncbi:hypothetical protein D7Z26_00780 [Cohnella endophytica]|uniref:Uncharacterized protein n=1 Tax=Cohnella endophytica TaxID=2419778 RepID=A0A494Y7L5_9BACL|nr:hypothetical protein [Cohnella endophytica]RKP58073.1 hypothetical protein D7Z26_00780 [Cohnella endophytica]